MRSLIFCFCFLSCSLLKTQNFFAGNLADNSFRRSSFFHKNDSVLTTKWSLNKYSSISTSFIGFKGGYATVVSAPIGLQFNRMINNNMFAFAGVSVAPSYINFHQSFMTADINKSSLNNSFVTRSNNFGLYPKAEVGLSYMNDDRTFQISGSIGIERNSYRMPVFMPITNTFKYQ